jgi:serine/threonine protein kinase
MAPEIISNSYYGISVDIWALGVLFYFMLFAEYPFKGISIITKVMTWKQKSIEDATLPLASTIP